MSVVRIVLRQKKLDSTTPNIPWFVWPPCPPPTHPNNKHWTSTPAGKASAHSNWLDDDSIIWMQYPLNHHELFVDIFHSMAVSSLISVLGFEHERMPETVNPHIPTISTSEFPRNAASGAWDSPCEHFPFMHFSRPLWALLQLKANWLLVALPDATSEVDWERSPSPFNFQLQT